MSYNDDDNNPARGILLAMALGLVLWILILAIMRASLAGSP